MIINRIGFNQSNSITSSRTEKSPTHINKSYTDCCVFSSAKVFNANKFQRIVNKSIMPTAELLKQDTVGLNILLLEKLEKDLKELVSIAGDYLNSPYVEHNGIDSCFVRLYHAAKHVPKYENNIISGFVKSHINNPNEMIASKARDTFIGISIEKGKNLGEVLDLLPLQINSKDYENGLLNARKVIQNAVKFSLEGADNIQAKCFEIMQNAYLGADWHKKAKIMYNLSEASSKITNPELLISIKNLFVLSGLPNKVTLNEALRNNYTYSTIRKQAVKGLKNLERNPSLPQEHKDEIAYLLLGRIKRSLLKAATLIPGMTP